MTETKLRERNKSKKERKKKPKVKRYNDDIFGYNIKDYDGYDDGIDEEE